MPHLQVLRLYQNRCGVWCYRLRRGKLDQRVSLGTKDPLAAHMMAAKINEAVEASRAMGGGPQAGWRNPGLDSLGIDLSAIRRDAISLSRGVAHVDSGGAHARLLEAYALIGSHGLPPPRRPLAPAAPPATRPTSLRLSEVAEKWLAERAHKNGPRTVYMKRCHCADFEKRVGRGIEIDSVGKAVLVGYKSACLAAGQKAKTIDNKLMSISDLFKYAIAHGLYNASQTSPVSGLFMQTKTERLAKAEPFKPFTEGDLKAIFEPEAYRVGMPAPDFYWCPLIGLYSGMRISEATGIHVEDVQTAENGVAFIHVRKSKTGAGVRNVPIAQPLLDLGFLAFVDKQQKAGQQRLFPDRLLINESYSKELGKRFRDYLMEQGVRRRGDKSERKSFHSFRVNVVTQLANNGANTIQVMRIVGHASGSAGLQTHMGYVRDLPDLKAIVDTLAWPVDITAMRSLSGALASSRSISDHSRSTHRSQRNPCPTSANRPSRRSTQQPSS